MEILQGDIFWVDLGVPSGSEPGYMRPHIVIQNNIFNKSKINTVVICALTTNLNRANSPGNILLLQGEGNLSKQSVVNVTQISTVDKKDLIEKIGAVSSGRLNEILDGIDLVLKPR
jgi:mRNA interferase MazF